MIARMRTCKQATRVAELTGGVQLAGKPKPDGTQTLSRYVDVGADFEPHRAVVESVSVLFDLYDGDADGYAASGSPGEPLPTGWMVTAVKFEVDWPTDPDRAALVRSHFGARRKAFNWGLAQVKADLDASRTDPAHESVDWDLKSLRWAWNRAKDTVAPWWATNSKECYSSGLADLAQGLANWKASKNGTRQGRRVGFPRFKSARRDAGRVRFTTGTMRLEDDRRTITVPVIGELRSKENTRRVQRHLAGGRAQILNMTLSQRWGRLFVSVCYALRTPISPPVVAQPTVRAGVDLGVRTLATVATIDTTTGAETIVEYPNPAPLKATLAARRRAGRELSRRIPGSHGHRTAKAKLSRLDRRCVHLRREAAHQLTTQLAGSYGHIVVEDLDVAAMKRSMGRRAYRRAVSDAAMGLVGPMLAYKTTRHSSTLTVADRWFASSQLHHGCTAPDGTPCRLEGKGRIDKNLVCPNTGVVVDRDRNAALNLRDWPDDASCGPVGTTAPSAPGPTTPVGTGHGADAGASGAGGASVRPRPRGAGRGEAKTPTPQGDAA
ncbi:transposase [Mycobacterium timonense]|uniref:Transposase n=2 Tax=Mycobacterium avium complex (MAC) TaxID=120793 RepID=A0AAW5RWR2_MYCBC|nr:MULTISPECIES: IS607 family element RNA-guided endonuclease TnpB [Mycobacterium avium complex (MAC)]MCV6987707.1 transposase [Mycobacterium bouchedurhonense]MCV6998078.1 transposase [Mycobacterium timonense]MDV3305651.1 IS607 family element transposase accessory protein TnpB [Mycobacterium avium subsp. hominissuis]ORA43753.1 transposase [Mycobacterium bouchedurhonense]ORB77277.1 transposase [Mycobacterium timonense]